MACSVLTNHYNFYSFPVNFPLSGDVNQRKGYGPFDVYATINGRSK